MVKKFLQHPFMATNGLIITCINYFTDKKKQWINATSEFLNFRKLHCSAIFLLARWLTPYLVPFNIKAEWCKKKKKSQHGKKDQNLIEHQTGWSKGKAKKQMSNVDNTILCHVSLPAPQKSFQRLTLLHIIHNKCSLTRPNSK